MGKLGRRVRKGIKKVGKGFREVKDDIKEGFKAGMRFIRNLHRKFVLLFIIGSLFIKRSDAATSLRITPESVRTNNITFVSSNFAIEPAFQVELIDGTGRRLGNSGIKVTTNVVGSVARTKTCLSDERNFELTNGIGTFKGSWICQEKLELFKLDFQIIDPESLKALKSSKVLKSGVSKSMQVVTEVHIAYFRPKATEKLLNDQLEDFMTYAVERMNGESVYGFPFYNPLVRYQRKVRLTTYKYDPGNLNSAQKALLTLRKVGKTTPEKKSHAIIGPGNDLASKVVLPAMMREKLSVLSFRKDISEEYSNKIVFPHFNRLQLSVDVFLDNVFLYLNSRKWTYLIVIYSDSDDFYGVLWETYAEKYNVTLIKYEIKGNLATGADYNLDSLFESVKGDGYRMVMTTAVGSTARNLFKYADKHKVTSKSGFQWIGLKNRASLKFLSSNSEEWCIHASTNPNVDPKLCCTEFKGMLILDNLYTNNFNTTESEYMWRGFLAGDSQKSIAHREYVQPADFPTKGVQYSLAYDALKTNILAIARLIWAKKTINGETLAREIRDNTNFNGMSGQVKLNQNGNRDEYIGSVTTLWPVIAYTKEHITDLTNHKQWIKREAEYSNWMYILRMEKKPTDNKFTMKLVSTDISRKLYEFVGKNSKEFKALYKAQLPISYWAPTESARQFSQNLVEETTCSGVVFHDEHLFLSNIPTALSNSKDGQFPKLHYTCQKATVKVPMNTPFYCSSGCGGISERINANKYANGECIKQDTCFCKTGKWTGKSCEIPICDKGKGCKGNGRHGKCISPDKCECDVGYKGMYCNVPLCTKCGREIFCNSTECSVNQTKYITRTVPPKEINAARRCQPIEGVPGKCRIGGMCYEPNHCACMSNHFDVLEGECAKKCTCNMDNAEGCSRRTGHCSKCKSFYFSPDSDCESNYFAVIFGTIAGLLFGGLLIYFITAKVIKTIRLKSALKTNDWVVNWEEVELAENNAKSQKSSMMISAVSMNTNKRAETQQFNIATWDGIDVYYQKLDIPTVNLSEQIRLEAKHVRDMKHVNICAMIGCCIEAPNVAILTEIAPKGSLEDIFSNEDIKLPWNFRFSLLKGIAAGMEYLTTKTDVKVHGRLKSSNCLIDNRWTVKLTGFGMNQFRISKEVKPRYESLLWTAPELLKDRPCNVDQIGKGTLANDIYAFGIIISEFCCRDIPYSEVLLEKEEMVRLIAGTAQDSNSHEIWDEYLAENNIEAGGPVRPVVKDNQWPKKYESRKMLKKLMESCWEEQESRRTKSFKDIINALNQIDPQNKEIMEICVSMLEMYSTNLEKMILKRTKQLEKESERTESLVSRLLPRAVAEALKQGLSVPPENFEHVTIYFSDIVGFTSIAKASTPFQVVALLNNMYTIFDSISARYDCYKVETIGDAYMIVSGLPTRNGDQHAAEICTTALYLMAAIGTIEVPHLPEVTLRLRSGIHTGNVVAGVVGLKMPRYCLFGDTCNVASEMESGGKPSRIQISGETDKILQRLGGYFTEYRHEVEVESIGVMSTYFLNGKAGFDEKMPDFDPNE